jgi:hypothetical protein
VQGAAAPGFYTNLNPEHVSDGLVDRSYRSSRLYEHPDQFANGTTIRRRTSIMTFINLSTSVADGSFAARSSAAAAWPNGA